MEFENEVSKIYLHWCAPEKPLLEILKSPRQLVVPVGLLTLLVFNDFEKVIEIALRAVETLSLRLDGVEDITVGGASSTKIALLAPSEPDAPGDGRVNVASFKALSLMVPLFNENELVAL